MIIGVNMKELVEFLNKCHIFFIATVDGKTPKVRPFGAINVYNDKLYFITNKNKDIYKQLISNNAVEICASTSDSWIRYSGYACFDEDVLAKKSMLDNNPGLRRMYNENNPDMAIFYLDKGVCTFYSFTSKPKVKKI